MDMYSSSMSMGSCKISMLWNWYTVDACFLTSSWHITNNGSFAASCIGVMLMVVMLEFLRRVGKEYDILILRQFQQQVAAQTAAARAKSSSPDSSGGCCVSPEATEIAPTVPQFVVFRATPLQQLIRAMIHAATFGLAYIIMLLAMYFNGYIIICIIIGAGIGKFLCDWMVHKVLVSDGEARSGAVTGVEETTVCCG